jgi:2-keto-4-pentenoate hydratase
MARLPAEALRRAAQFVTEAMTSGSTLAPFPEELAPRTVAQGGKIASLVLAGLSLAPVGIRLSPAPEGMGGASLAGPVLGPRLIPSPSPPPPFHRVVATAAIVAQLAKPLPARERRYGLRDVLGRIATLHPAIDVAASRFTAGAPDLACHLADLCGHGVVVFGRQARAGWAEAIATPRALRTTGPAAWRGTVDIGAALRDAAEAARTSGGLPAGAVLVIAGLSPALGEGDVAVAITSLGGAALSTG